MTTSKYGRASFSSSSGALLAIPHARTHGESDLVPSSQNTPAYTVADPPYISNQLKSSEWLHRYGLKSQKLTFDQILQQIGFKRVESLNASVDKRASAKYAGNVFQEIQNDNGDRYALTCRPEKLREFRNRLIRMLNILRKRLAFLTSGSRRLFGLLGEPSVCLVCDCKTTDNRIFNQFQSVITNLIKEQISKIKRFNIIWVTNDNEVFQEQSIDVTSTTIDQAIDWIANRKIARNKISISATCEAILKAFTNTVHCIYLISEGNSSDSAREILRDNIVKTRLASTAPIPIHVVSLFCQNNDTELFLRSISQSANGNYYSSKIKNEITDFKTPANLTGPTRMKLQVGTNALTSTLDYPIDISLMYKEINECQNIIDRLDKILGSMRDENENSLQTTETTKSLDALNISNKSIKQENNLQRSLIIQSSALFNHDENSMASIDWLKIYGVDAQKLDFYSILQSAAIQHCDGVVGLQKPPTDTDEKTSNTSAYPKDKLISAKYCDQFAHVTWPDGTIRHVYVTSELHRDYERRIKALLEKIKARLSWLKKGSRDIFGTILEKNIYILIDTSKSMENHLSFVKDKLHLLIQDQLLSKERVNMASFNTILNPWRDRLTKINDLTIQSQLEPWIDGLHAEGSTNTLAAIRFALADSDTEGIYLLTDGRPDQNERYILSQVQYRQIIPIHTIAFNCQDQNANQFLFDLAKITGGRFHAFNYGLEGSSSIEIPESEDITYLKQEIIHGEKDLQRVADLRDECMGRTWSQDNIQTNYKNPQVNEQFASFQIQSYSTLDLSLQTNSSATMPQLIERTKRSSASSNRKKKSKSALIIEEINTLNFNPDERILPETQEYLRKPDKKRKSISTIENDEESEPDSIEPIEKIRKPFDQVKAYLKKNSLVSKGLTIFDVLQPVSVTVKEPQHVQVIDRYALAKVWDDILPLTYGSYVNKFRLVNHYAVNLERYEVKLRDLIKDYYRFTSEFIWECLSDEDKRRAGPHIYWVCLSKEDQYKHAQEITKEEHKKESGVEYFAWQKLTNDEQNNLLKKPVVYHERTAEVLKIALQNAKCESGLQGLARMDVEIKRANKFLQISNDLRQYQKRVDHGVKPPAKPEPSTKGKFRLKFGQRVICRYDGDGYYYTGTIQINHMNQFIVLFDMEIEQRTIGHVILPINLNNQLNLFLQDCVLVRQLREMEEYWAPGVVLCLPSPFALPPNLYKIQVYDPFSRQIYAHRKDMIRINFGLFQKSVLYLQNISRGPIINGTIITGQRNTSSLSKEEVEIILENELDPLKEKVDHLRQSHHERYGQLQTGLEDNTGAIRLLQERSFKSRVKFEYAQTAEISVRPPPRIVTPPPGPVTPRPKSVGSQTELARPPPAIKTGTEVYAIWFEDDGLAYKGTIRKSLGSDNYTVERKDFPGVESTIFRNDIFLDSSLHRLKDMHAQSFALIEYPNDSRHCFCPAVILRHHRHESKTTVRFYDCYEEDLSNDQMVIKITEEQFKQYAETRIKKENLLINQVIVGFNPEKKSFMLGTVKERVDTGHRYSIEWSDGSLNKQKEEHLFGAFNRRNKHRRDYYVLAMDDSDEIYKPAKTISILNDQKLLKVEFINLDRTEEHSPPRIANVPATTTFVITKDYLNTIRKLRLLRT